MSFFGAAGASTAPAPTADKDIEVPEPPSDSISSLAFSSAADYLAVGSWDNNVACPFFTSCKPLTRDTGPFVRGRRRRSDAGQGHVWSPGPRTQRLLEQGGSDICPSFEIITVNPKEGNKVISGGADNAARMFDITNGQTTQVAQHDAPIKVVKWIETPQGGILATGSWDKTLKVCAHHH